jgi:hypothetical protein
MAATNSTRALKFLELNRECSEFGSHSYSSFLSLQPRGFQVLQIDRKVGDGRCWQDAAGNTSPAASLTFTLSTIPQMTGATASPASEGRQAGPPSI